MLCPLSYRRVPASRFQPTGSPCQRREGAASGQRENVSTRGFVHQREAGLQFVSPIRPRVTDRVRAHPQPANTCTQGEITLAPIETVACSGVSTPSWSVYGVSNPSLSVPGVSTPSPSVYGVSTPSRSVSGVSIPSLSVGLAVSIPSPSVGGVLYPSESVYGVFYTVGVGVQRIDAVVVHRRRVVPVAVGWRGVESVVVGRRRLVVLVAFIIVCGGKLAGDQRYGRNFGDGVQRVPTPRDTIARTSEPGLDSSVRASERIARDS